VSTGKGDRERSGQGFDARRAAPSIDRTPPTPTLSRGHKPTLARTDTGDTRTHTLIQTLVPSPHLAAPCDFGLTPCAAASARLAAAADVDAGAGAGAGLLSPIKSTKADTPAERSTAAATPTPSMLARWPLIARWTSPIMLAAGGPQERRTSSSFMFAVLASSGSDLTMDDANSTEAPRNKLRRSCACVCVCVCVCVTVRDRDRERDRETERERQANLPAPRARTGRCSS
jgi:hypothetical protein